MQEPAALYAFDAEHVGKLLWSSLTAPAASLGGFANSSRPSWRTARSTPPAATARSASTVYAQEYQTCNAAGSKTVRYGAGNSFVYKSVIGPFACTNTVFGDPTPNGTQKMCQVLVR